MKRALAFILLVLFLLVFAGCSSKNPENTNNYGSNSRYRDGRRDINELEYAVGDTFKMGNLQFTVNGMRLSEGDGEWNVPSEGSRFIYIDITVENAGDKDITVNSIITFDLCDLKGNSFDLAFVVDAKGRLDGKLAPGKKMKGEVAYEVPADVKEFDLKINPDILGNEVAHVKIKADE